MISLYLLDVFGSSANYMLLIPLVDHIESMKMALVWEVVRP